ncbi:MAG: ABC transporter permease [Bdellovibrionota bacterium]
MKVKILRPIIAAMSGIAIGLIIVTFAGENPWNVFRILVKSAFGTKYDLGMTLFYSTPLVFTGLSVAVAFRAGLFNIGAEGQLTMGALAAAAVGIIFPELGSPWAPMLGVRAAFSAGACWGAIPGWLKARRGAHEVINTIMLNFVAAGISSWVVLYLLKNTESQNPETMPIGHWYFVRHLEFFGDAPVSTALFLAIIVSLLVSFFLWRTVLGFEISAVGCNEKAARVAGIDPGKIQLLAMALAGGLAGLVGVSEVLGNAGKFRIGFSPDFGFMGIAVALLGRNNPTGVVIAALLFGALHKGTSDLDLETEYVTRDLSMVLQSLVIISVAADGLWDQLGTAIKRKFRRDFASVD